MIRTDMMQNINQHVKALNVQAAPPSDKIFVPLILLFYQM